PSSERRHSQPRGVGGQSRAICFLLNFLRPGRRGPPRVAAELPGDLLRPNCGESNCAFDLPSPFSTADRKGALYPPSSILASVLPSIESNKSSGQSSAQSLAQSLARTSPPGSLAPASAG